MKKSVKILLSLLAIAALAICLVCCFFIYQYFRGGMLNDQMGELTDSSVSDREVFLIPTPPNQLFPSSQEEPSPEPERPDWYLHVDFDALAEINPDIYAWIDIPGTGISYAVVQHPTNDLYYNNHSVDKAYYSGGSIYTQRYNSKTFEDPVTVLYGHNRTSKTMFAPVNDFASKEFFDANPYIYIYTPEKVYQYEIFASYPHSSEHLLLNHNFSSEKQFSNFFGGLDETIDSNYREELFPQAGDRVITLSTCYKNNRMQRYLVQGVLTMEYTIEVQETAE